MTPARVERLLAVMLLPFTAFADPSASSSPPAATPSPTRGYFSDVPPDHWAAAAVNELAARGILLGYPAAPAGRPRAAPARIEPPRPHRATPLPRRRARRG